MSMNTIMPTDQDSMAQNEKVAGGASDDSEDDEDFVPTEHMDDDEEDTAFLAGSTAALSAPLLSAAKRKAVDEAFEDLFGYPFGTVFTPKRQRRRVAAVSKRERILMDIFGPAIATTLLATSSNIRHLERPTTILPRIVQETVMEVKRFAGRDITIQKKVQVEKSMEPSKTPNHPTNKQVTTSTVTAGLDQVLAEISGPSKMSTVAKTSADWDAFKTETGVEEELEKQAQGKNAFLVKKDFLQRVDARRFEHEKARRDQDRTSRKVL